MSEHPSRFPSQVAEQSEINHEKWSQALKSLSSSLELADDGRGSTFVLLDRKQSSDKFVVDLQKEMESLDFKLIVEKVAIPVLDESSAPIWKHDMWERFQAPLPATAQEGDAQETVRVFVFDLTHLSHGQQFSVVAVLNTMRDRALSAKGRTLVLSTADTYAQPITKDGPAISGCRDLISCSKILFVD